METFGVPDNRVLVTWPDCSLRWGLSGKAVSVKDFALPLWFEHLRNIFSSQFENSSFKFQCFCTICCLKSDRGRENLHTWALTHDWAGQQTRSRRTRRADTVWCHFLLLDSRQYASSPARRKIVFPWSLISRVFCAAPFKIGCYCSCLNYGFL